MPKTAKARRNFPIENKEKEWTSKDNYKTWVRKIKTIKKIHRKPAEDLCAGKNSICKNDLGIPRKFMPQFTLRRAPFSQNPIKKFRKYIKETYGINSYKGKRRAIDLKPSQGEISRVRVDGLLNDNIINTIEVPLVISNDNYIADGHHRWAAFRLEAPQKPIDVIVIDAPIKDVIGLAISWGATTQSF
jgi:hypothetical protein